MPTHTDRDGSADEPRRSRRRRHRVLVGAVMVLGFGTGVTRCTRAERTPGTEQPAVVPAESTTVRVVSDGPDSVRAVGSVSSPSSAGDTARGIVRRVGSEPITRMVLEPVRGETLILVGGDSSIVRELDATEGLEIAVTGEQTTERLMDVAPGGTPVFRVRQFAVRAVDGVDARDGILRNVDGVWYLETSPSVRQPIVGLPTALRDQAGGRIFLVGSPTVAPQAFGVLRAP